MPVKRVCLQHVIGANSSISIQDTGKGGKGGKGEREEEDIKEGENGRDDHEVSAQN